MHGTLNRRRFIEIGFCPLQDTQPNKVRKDKQPNQDREEIEPSEESERNSSGSSADEEEMGAEPLKAAPYVPLTRRGPEQIRILSHSKPLDLPTARFTEGYQK